MEAGEEVAARRKALVDSLRAAVEADLPERNEMCWKNALTRFEGPHG